MARLLPILLTLIVTSNGVAAPIQADRAWQQRLHIEMPLSVPVVQLETANPFSVDLDVSPTLVSSTAPRKLELKGEAVVAGYIDTRGQCLGVVPLETPFPGLTSGLVTVMTSNRFEPARLGKQATPTWVVVGVNFETKVKEATILHQELTIPNPEIPPSPMSPAPVRPPGQLLNLPFSPPSGLRELAVPKRIKVRLSGRTTDITIRALVHITKDGRCDRYVPLEMFSGFDLWFARYLATWNLQPGQRNGVAVDSWAVYTSRITVKMGGLDSTNYRTIRDRSYDPQDSLK